MRAALASLPTARGAWPHACAVPSPPALGCDPVGQPLVCRLPQRHHSATLLLSLCGHRRQCHPLPAAAPAASPGGGPVPGRLPSGVGGPDVRAAAAPQRSAMLLPSGWPRWWLTCRSAGGWLPKLLPLGWLPAACRRLSPRMPWLLWSPAVLGGTLLLLRRCPCASAQRTRARHCSRRPSAVAASSPTSPHHAVEAAGAARHSNGREVQALRRRLWQVALRWRLEGTLQDAGAQWPVHSRAGRCKPPACEAQQFPAIGSTGAVVASTVTTPPAAVFPRPAIWLCRATPCIHAGVWDLVCLAAVAAVGTTCCVRGLTRAPPTCQRFPCTLMVPLVVPFEGPTAGSGQIAG